MQEPQIITTSDDAVKMYQTEPTMTSMPLQTVQQHAVAAVTPADLLRHAMDSGADLDRLERLMDIQERWEANEARKAFAAGMAEFKKNPPKIFKDKHVSFESSKGTTAYDHATIGNVCEQVISALAAHGFSHRWVPEQKSGNVIITCVITHRLGHEQRTTMEAGPDSSGGKNGIQSIASAKSYLERYTLLAATGLATNENEDDGAAAGLDPNAVRDAVADKAPAKHKIGQSQLKTAITSIQKGDYNYVDLVGYYDLSPEQLALVHTELGMPA